MDSKDSLFLLSMTVLFPFLSGLVRVKTISRLYRPFLLLIATGVLTEIISRITINYFRNNNLVINIYSLTECLLIIAQFYYWRYHSRTKRWYPYFGILCIGIWIWENLIYRDGFIEVGSIFRVSEAFILVILSINEINYLLINDNKNLLKNARFLICAGFLIYFLYQILLEGSIYISTQQQGSIIARIIEVSSYINAFVNIIYGIAVWYIPKRTTLQFKDRIEH
jgi:hypothetical protein